LLTGNNSNLREEKNPPEEENRESDNESIIHKY
jgi:hypothetical protein